MKYRVGEYVKVKENAKDIYAGLGFITPDMDKFCGNIYKIASCSKTYYKLEDVANEECYRWWWDEVWLEPATDNYSDIKNEEIMDLFT